MDRRTRGKNGLTILFAILALGTAGLTYSAFVLARSLGQIGSQLLAGFLEQALQGIAAIVALMMILEIATMAVLWTTLGPVSALARAAWLYLTWGGT